MQYEANSPEDYINQLPEDRKEAITKLRAIIKKNLPKGFEETISYGMIGYVVPHAIYPDGYHCTPELPLPFMNIASQKNSINVYHSGVYAKKELYDWFVAEYPKHCKRKLDMGKSCVRFKYLDDIPYQLIGELASKMTVETWITIYEKNIKKT
ncbi:DUF1801 domain-containing protein [Mariniflexile sp. AS56]|uniref:DUF1801 domain-containing protein n=1 Tax=Mariniflexile sp. AS56 TaxID=3063957 RepID=UPI0026EAE0BF|nr:DUF1801 domain-containing protein [Mariniflexile sp. AS56]MDO7173472.1 DUF1801 domain-containing protein [Mariniflexile sp. AS56]